MGFDTSVYIFDGYKIPLQVAFDNGLLNPDIVNGDDYQLIDDPDCRDGAIERNVLNSVLKNFLMEYKNWNLYILTSSQEDCDASKSWMFLYEHKTIYAEGSPEDYSCGVVCKYTNQLYPSILNDIPIPFGWKRENHITIESSW